MSDSDSFFCDAELRMNKLWQQFASAPEVFVTGVVSPFGPGRGSDGQSSEWTLTFSFVAWRPNGNGIQDVELSIRQRMTHDELTSTMNRIEPYQILRVRIRLVVKSALGTPQAQLVEVVGPVEDSELQVMATKLREPVTINDDRFGTLTLDRRLDRFDGVTTWNGTSVRLTIAANGETVNSESLSFARKLFEEESNWAERINDYAVRMLHGQTWLEEEDEIELSREEFLNRMKLTDIGVSSDGHFDFWHDDGELFWGHSIVVYGDFDNGPTSIDTPG